MKTVDTFKINLNNEYQTKIRDLLTLEFESHIENFVQ